MLTVHRDFGDRTNRRHARLKYVLAERGVEWFRGEVEQRAGITLEEARPFEFERQGDLFGWHEAADGSWFLGLHVLAGRVKDGLKTALREIVDGLHAHVRLEPPAGRPAGPRLEVAAHEESVMESQSNTRE